MDVSAPQMTPGPDASDFDPVPEDDSPSDVVLAPAEAFPRIDLRAAGEPWERRRAAGKQLRREVPHAVHAEAIAADGRPDPVDLVERSNAGRQARLCRCASRAWRNRPSPSCAGPPASWPSTSRARPAAASTW